MKKIKAIWTFVSLLFFAGISAQQNTKLPAAVLTGGANCNNLDFGNGSHSGWQGKWNNAGGSTGTYGSYTMNSLNSSGFNKTNYVHELCTGGWDPNVAIKRVPPGHTYSMRLGNDSAYRVFAANSTSSLPHNHQLLTNSFLITSSNQFITYWYAVVLTSNLHPAAIQPYFKIRVFDGSGAEIFCAHYDVDGITASTIGGFLKDSVYLNNIGQYYGFLYKDWTQVSIPLGNYIGQTITVNFETSDCANGGHPAYAYVVADCTPLPQISFTPLSCARQNTVLSAPSGMASYQWTGPGIVGAATNQTVTVNAPGSYSVTMTTLGNGGVNCTMYLDTVVTSSPSPHFATFTAAPACLGTATTFTNTSPGIYSHVKWTFGDGSVDTTNIPTTHTYTATGTYTVSLALQNNNNGCRDTFTSTVVVYPSPTCLFVADTVCQGAVTSFTNSCIGATAYNWNFGDGTGPSSIQSPAHLYASAGHFTVTLVSTNSYNCSKKATQIILVNAAPQISFSVAPVCSGNTSIFINSTTPANGVVYHWDFGDSSTTADTSSQKNPSYTYPAPGTYTVLLQAGTLAGCMSTQTLVAVVKPVPVLTLDTLGSYCWGSMIPVIGYTVTPGNILFTWINTNPQIGLPARGTGIPPAFTAGINVNGSNISGVITVTPSLNGCMGAAQSFTVTIKPTPITNHANISYCPDVVTPVINFTATPGGSTINWTNTTPQVNTGLTQNSGTSSLPSFTTSNPGNTNASSYILLQASLNGCIGPTNTFFIVVTPFPVAEFTNSIACDGLITYFRDASTIGSGSISQWGWDVNHDGIFTDASANNPSFILSPVGTHTISLVVTSGAGCTDTVSHIINVNPSAQIFVNSAQLSGCSPVTVVFHDSTYVAPPEQVVKYIWDFGNGQSVIRTTNSDATMTYSNSSNTQAVYYPVTISAVTSAGCTTKLVKSNYVTVFPRPRADFWTGPDRAEELDPVVYFHDASVGAGKPNGYLWSFGDSVWTSLNFTSTASPIHFYPGHESKIYSAMQVVKNNYGCVDSVIKPVTIYPSTTFYVPNAFTPNYDGLNDVFKAEGIEITDFDMWIYDRWGKEIFHSSNIENGWDGKVNGVMAQQDTYTWKISFNGAERKSYLKSGSVSLMR